jgi:hypothetical protein
MKILPDPSYIHDPPLALQILQQHPMFSHVPPRSANRHAPRLVAFPIIRTK